MATGAPGNATQLLNSPDPVRGEPRIVLTGKPYTGLMIPGTNSGHSTGFLLWMIRLLLLITG
jgi:hypothetical protein